MPVIVTITITVTITIIAITVTITITIIAITITIIAITITITITQVFLYGYLSGVTAGIFSDFGDKHSVFDTVPSSLHLCLVLVIV
jgi:hypothetical protein